MAERPGVKPFHRPDIPEAFSAGNLQRMAADFRLVGDEAAVRATYNSALKAGNCLMIGA